jgi:3-phosphoshikimate 1-carboxyvinyltransferase
MTDTRSVQFHVNPGGSLQGRLRVPGDKSISHRSIMLGSLAKGVTEVSGFLEGEDSLATLAAFRAMGVVIDGPAAGRVSVHGVGMHGLRRPAAALDLGNSGTSMRLMAGLLAGQAFDVTLTGDASLSGRPMRRVVDPLGEMGATIMTTDTGTAPLQIRGGSALQGIDYVLPVASAQVKSSVLLAGLYASGRTCVTEPAPTRDHTERMLAGMGYPLQRQGSRVCLEGGHSLQGIAIDIPADISSAAFFLAGASLAPGSDLLLQHVGMNPTRTGVIEILRLMGADIEVIDSHEVGGEPVADLRVRSAGLTGIDIPPELVPLAIDEFPVLFVAASCASGRTVLTGAEELRVKESDRIQVMADGLVALGIDAQATPDGMIIEGGTLQGGHVDSHGDHRIAMAFSMAALRASGTIEIRDCANVNTSFPGFVDLAAQAGLRIAAMSS